MLSTTVYSRSAGSKVVVSKFRIPIMHAFSILYFGGGGGDLTIKDLATRPFTHRTASGERGKWRLHVYSCLSRVVRISNDFYSDTSLASVPTVTHRQPADPAQLDSIWTWRKLHT